MSESTAWQFLRNQVARNADRFDRFENLLGAGYPDVNYCILATEGWIEVKAPKEPKRTTTPLFGSNHKLSQEQANWMLRQRQAGGLAFIFIQTDKRRMLVEGSIDMKLNEMTVGEIINHHTCLWAATIRGCNAETVTQLRRILAGA